MKVMCSWCTKEISSGVPLDPDRQVVSHGICPDCVTFLNQNSDGTLQSFLDRLPAPVLVLGSDGRILRANDKAAAVLNKPLAELPGCLGGDAMECAYARRPGGCGQTEHCKSCTIRRSVNETFTTGQSLFRVPAYQDLVTASGTRQTRFLISTELAGQVVLLRIDELGAPPANAASLEKEKAMVSLADFQAFELIVARIMAAREHPNADRLYVLKVDTGSGEKQLVAGIRSAYTPEELIGRQIVMINNLEPAVIRGEESQGMLLAVKDEQGVSLLSPGRPVALGSRVS